MPLEYFTEQLLRVADLLYEAGLYSLARTHGYRKCLMTGGLLLGDRRNSSEALEQYVSSGNRSEKMVLALVSDVCAGFTQRGGRQRRDHEILTQCALFCIDSNTKKGTLSQQNHDACCTSSGWEVLHV